MRGAVGAVVFNEDGVDRDFRIEGDTDVNLFFVDAGNDRIGVRVSSPAGQYHIKQAGVSAAIPVQVLEQDDIDDTFINYIGTSASDGTRSISSDTTEDSAKFGAFRVEINGVTKWVRVYDDHS